MKKYIKLIKNKETVFYPFVYILAPVMFLIIILLIISTQFCTISFLLSPDAEILGFVILSLFLDFSIITILILALKPLIKTLKAIYIELNTPEAEKTNNPDWIDKLNI